MSCFHCGSPDIIWDCDYSFEDFLIEGEGIVHICHCPNCGARIETYVEIPEDEEDKGGIKL